MIAFIRLSVLKYFLHNVKIFCLNVKYTLHLPYKTISHENNPYYPTGTRKLAG